MKNLYSSEVSIFEADAILKKLIEQQGADIGVCERACDVFFSMPINPSGRLSNKEDKKEGNRGWFDGLLKGATNCGDVSLGGRTPEDAENSRITWVRAFERIGSFYVWRSEEECIVFQNFMWAGKEIPFEALPDKGLKYFLFRKDGKFSCFGKEERGEVQFSLSWTLRTFSFLTLMNMYVQKGYVRVLQKSEVCEKPNLFEDKISLFAVPWF